MWQIWLHLGTFQPICDSKRENLSYLNRIIFTGMSISTTLVFTSCFSQHDKSHHVKITQLKSDGSNWVRKRAKKGAEQSRNQYWPISIYWHYTAKVICYHIGQSLSTYLLPIYWSYWLLVYINSSPYYYYSDFCDWV